MPSEQGERFVRVGPEVIERIDAFAAVTGESRAQATRVLLEMALGAVKGSKVDSEVLQETVDATVAFRNAIQSGTASHDLLRDAARTIRARPAHRARRKPVM